MCPGLLPNRSIITHRMGLLTNYFTNRNELLIIHAGENVHGLRPLLTDSGHYLLATDNYKDKSPKETKKIKKENKLKIKNIKT